MIWAFLTLGLIVYSMGIFFITAWEILLWILTAHIALILVLRINPIKLFRNIIMVSPFIIFTGLINWAFSDFENALMIMARIFLLCNMTFIFSQTVPLLKFARGLSILLLPLKIFRINTRNIAVTISVAITFVPILRSEYRGIRQGMNARGKKKRGIGIATRIFGFRILYRASILSNTLDAKGYN